MRNKKIWGQCIRIFYISTEVPKDKSLKITLEQKHKSSENKFSIIKELF